MEINGADAGFVESSAVIDAFGKADTVGVNLDVPKLPIFRHFNEFGEVFADSRFAATELESGSWHGTIGAKVLEHLLNLFFGRLVDIPRFSSVSKANRAAKVAAVGDVNDSKASVALVFRADAAVLRATFHSLGARVVQSFPYLSEFLRPLILIVVAPVELVIFAMVRASLFHIYFIVFLVDSRI